MVSTGGEPEFGRPPEGVELRLVEPGPPRSRNDEPWLRKHVRHYVSGRPWLYRAAEHHLDALAAVVADEIRSFRPDLVMISHEELSPLVHIVPPVIVSKTPPSQARNM